MKVLISTVALTAAIACKPASDAKPPPEVKATSPDTKPPPEVKAASPDAKPPFVIKEVSTSKFQATEGGNTDEALVAECAKWRLTKEQAQRFFQISTSYKESPYSEYYQLPCSIKGVVEAEGKTWEFIINAGATAVWKSGNEVRYFGCSAPACEPLVLMMPDGMDP
jgi:hypothetical protein